MKILLFALCGFVMGCNTSTEKNDTTLNQDSTVAITSSPAEEVKDKIPEPADTVKQNVPKQYANQRFKEVTVEKISGTKFRVKGKAQIFEASFSWVIEDGHNELQKGYNMTDAGAPEWGNFDFTVDAKKARPNSTLHLILFEISAKDGSRQHELPLLLY